MMKKQQKNNYKSGGMYPPPSGSGQAASGPSMGQPGPVQDWQRTGYRMEDAPCDDVPAVDDTNDRGYFPADHDRPVPPDLDVDPMARTGVDERLAEQRSRTVREHMGSFWASVRSDGKDGKKPASEENAAYANPESAASPDTGNAASSAQIAVSGPLPPTRAHPGGRVMVYVLVVVAVLVGVAAMVGTEMFRITDIRVVGNHVVPAEEIIRLSGIRKGGNILALSDDRIAEAISGNRYLKLVCVEHDNHTVTLQVYEREAAAFTVVRGIYYVMDRQGMVLEEYADEGNMAAHLIRADKLNVHSCIVGKQLSLYDEGVLEAYIQLMLEFRAMGIADQIKELYLDDLDNISLSTRSGYFVRMGDETYLHGKLRSMTLVMEELQKRGYQGGTIDVSVREKPTYSPESAALPEVTEE